MDNDRMRIALAQRVADDDGDREEQRRDEDRDRDVPALQLLGEIDVRGEVIDDPVAGVHQHDAEDGVGEVQCNDRELQSPLRGAGVGSLAYNRARSTATEKSKGDQTSATQVGQLRVADLGTLSVSSGPKGSRRSPLATERLELLSSGPLALLCGCPCYPRQSTTRPGSHAGARRAVTPKLYRWTRIRYRDPAQKL